MNEDVLKRGIEIVFSCIRKKERKKERKIRRGCMKEKNRKKRKKEITFRKKE